MSAAEVLTPMPRLADRDPADRDHYEVIDGVPVELPPMSTDSQVLASRLVRHLGNHGADHDLGEAVSETLFKLPLPVDRNRRPDVAFVPYSRAPRNARLPSTSGWEVLPDLCVEVVSPTDTADEIMDKVREYFQAGVRLVWVFYPRHDLVHVYESLTAVRGLNRADDLDGGAVLPGFRLPLTELFPAPPAQP
ncbi:MAG: Uma2 family endonuclease [Gemmataceae bacterium]|nr:Uma2 family endonuclease [Gemmataceae bacterium]